MNVKIIIATHKQYKMPEEEIYLPLQVGKEGKSEIGYSGDNSGDNISNKNNSFCELTGLYWGWKNLQCDYLGLVHYRRHFTVKKPIYKMIHNPMRCVLSTQEIAHFIHKYDIILPKKRTYYIETLYTHYEHTHYKEHLDVTREIIKEKYPEYLNTLDLIYNQRYGYMFNMFIMRKDLSDAYCKWLFDILFELEKQISMPQLSAYQGRFYGRISEIIFNCWLAYQLSVNNYSVKEIGYLYIEKVNWIYKGYSFLTAKFLHKKYSESF